MVCELARPVLYHSCFSRWEWCHVTFAPEAPGSALGVSRRRCVFLTLMAGRPREEMQPRVGS